MPINDFVEDLYKFSDELEGTDEFDGIAPDLISDLSSFTTAEGTSTALIEKTRGQLKKLLPKTDIQKEGVSLGKTAFNGLLALAEFKPNNEVDPITQDPIESDNVVYSSSGHQFSITNLIHFHNTRDYRGTQLGEQFNSKWLINPITNARFDLMDVAHIQAVAQQKGIEIKDLRTSGAIPVEPPAWVPTDSNDVVVDSNSDLTDWLNSASENGGIELWDEANIDLSTNPLSSYSSAQLAAVFAALPASVVSLDLSSNNLGSYSVQS